MGRVERMRMGMVVTSRVPIPSWSIDVGLKSYLRRWRRWRVEEIEEAGEVEVVAMVMANKVKMW